MGNGRDIIYALGALALSPIWGLSMLRTGKWRTDWPARFGQPPATTPTTTTPPATTTATTTPDEISSRQNQPSHTPRLLIHAVSVGEINATRSLVTWFEQNRPDIALTICTTTDTGTARARALYADRHQVERYPFDFTRSIKTFLDRVQPSAIALMELEVWPNFVDICHQRDIPVLVINGRLTARSFRYYKIARKLFESVFAKLAYVGVQTQDYRDRFTALGVQPQICDVLDTMKWDTAQVINATRCPTGFAADANVESKPDHAALLDQARALAADLGVDLTRPIVVAGSTALGEDQLLIDALPHWPAGTQFIIAPRKPEWFNHVLNHAPNAIRRSQNPAQQSASTITPPRPIDPTTNVFLLDTIGELRAAYALADVVVVGRSFNGDLYGSDMMEPIALQKATVIGPYYEDFEDAMHTFLEADGVLVSPAEQLAQTVADLLTHPSRAADIAQRGQQVILSRQGATERYAKAILKHIPDSHQADSHQAHPHQPTRPHHQPTHSAATA